MVSGPPRTTLAGAWTADSSAVYICLGEPVIVAIVYHEHTAAGIIEGRRGQDPGDSYQNTGA